MELQTRRKHEFVLHADFGETLKYVFCSALKCDWRSKSQFSLFNMHFIFRKRDLEEWRDRGTAAQQLSAPLEGLCRRKGSSGAFSERNVRQDRRGVIVEQLRGSAAQHCTFSPYAGEGDWKPDEGEWCTNCSPSPAYGTLSRLEGEGMLRFNVHQPEEGGVL